MSTGVTFKVIKSDVESAYYQRYDGVKHHTIAVSSRGAGKPLTLLRLMAHEMIHLKQAICKTETPNTMHNAEFRLLSKRVCSAFGWDEKDFYF